MAPLQRMQQHVHVNMPTNMSDNNKNTFAFLFEFDTMQVTVTSSSGVCTRCSIITGYGGDVGDISRVGLQ